MRRLPILAMALASAGCVYSPADLVERGTRFTHSASSEPRTLAQCLARNAQQFGLLVNVVDGARPDEHLIAVSLHKHPSAWAHAEVSPAKPPARSQAVVYITPIAMAPDKGAAMLLKDC